MILCKDDKPCYLPECAEHGCMALQMDECLNCHNADRYCDYEGPTCEVCNGLGFVPHIVSMNPKRTGGDAEGKADRIGEALVGSPGGGVRTLVVGDTDGKEPSPIQIISQTKTQIGQVAVTFTVGRIR